MNLLNLKIIKNQDFKDLINALKDINNKTKVTISYHEFKELLINFFYAIMKSYLTKSNLLDNKNYQNFSFQIQELPRNIDGKYVIKESTIIINESIILDIYHGNLHNLKTIFHELNHFKIDCDLENSIPNINLYRILKEKLLYSSTIEPEDYYKTKEAKSIDYYDSNYNLYSCEIMVELNAIKDLLLFFTLIELDYSNLKELDLLNYILELENNWNNYNRDSSHVTCFNDNQINLYEAFEYQLNYNKNWLQEFPILKYEYYLDKDNNLIKRTIPELIILLKNETDSKIQKFLYKLINSRLEFETDFHDKKNKNI